ncbi:MAG: oxygen-dependent coproporphyrinogen oxidase [Alphaproteobacteria bacterium]|nr:oxygen-dependent coproporphyrinogen oxidase [Alphaproteobacteria bacterium]
MRTRFHEHVRDLQDRICAALQAVDPGLVITEDTWTRTDHVGEEGGGGRTRVLAGDVVENAGVNTSCVYGALDPAFARQLGGDGADTLWAAGISLIVHPRNPRVPTTHANFRMVGVGARTWFGGGADLTPYYPHTDDFRHFHGTWRDATAPWGTYAAWKDWCDRYFTNTHRDGEMRGIGGIFFDHVASDDPAADQAMVRALSEQFLPSYLPIVQRRKDEAWTEADETFMLHRRGRYVEFNLLHDRGTKFGLQTNGRTDSILVSLPARVRFGYRWSPEPGSPHAEMMAYYRPHDWA